MAIVIDSELRDPVLLVEDSDDGLEENGDDDVE